MGKETALVTGATGFIGHHLCRRLKKLGIAVVGVSRSKVVSDDADSWLVCDLANAEQVEDMMARIRPDYIFHLASHVVGARDVALVRQTFEDNLLSTLNLLIAAQKMQCKRLVLTGSLEEPQPDKEWALPSSPYAAAKFAANAYGRMFYSLYGLPVITLRLFMVYGHEQRDLKKLIPYTILSLQRGEPPQLSGGDRAVDWIYVDDVVDAFVACLNADKANGATIDIGTGILTTVRDVVTMIASTIKPNIEIGFGDVAARKNEQIRVANTELAGKLLAWQSKTMLEAGLATTIDSLKAK